MKRTLLLTALLSSALMGCASTSDEHRRCAKLLRLALLLTVTYQVLKSVVRLSHHSMLLVPSQMASGCTWKTVKCLIKATVSTKL